MGATCFKPGSASTSMSLYMMLRSQLMHALSDRIPARSSLPFKEKTIMSTKNTLIAVITAAATGAAMLLAPASGKKTRKKLMKEAESVKDTVTYRLMQAEEEVRHLRDKLGKKGAAAAEKANA